MLPDHEIEIRVRYYETDAQGFVHHANYFQYFELARVEQLLALGYDYAHLERDGVLLVVSKITCKYHRPSKFGDTLRLQIRTVRAQERGSITSTACCAERNFWLKAKARWPASTAKGGCSGCRSSWFSRLRRDKRIVSISVRVG